MTPFEIDILLHYATKGDDHPLMFNPPPIWRETIARFLADGLLKVGAGLSVAYVATDRLIVYANALQKVPLPIQVWVMPRSTKEISEEPA